MRSFRRVRVWGFLFCVFCCVELEGQIENCVGAQVICSDVDISFLPIGTNLNDFSNPNNDFGCLDPLSTTDERAWYYFEFESDMPPNSSIEFTLEVADANEDYDFAIFGPNVGCDSLGSVIRCSAAFIISPVYAFGTLTGMGMGTTDTSEDQITGDGFIAPLEVQPGEGYYLLINAFGNPDGFNLTWGGSAAPFLRCDATPGCPGLSVDAGTDVFICQGDTLLLEAEVNGFQPNATYLWQDTANISQLLNDTTALEARFVVPDTLTGIYELVFSAQDGNCMAEDRVRIIINPSPIPQLLGDTLLCADSMTILETSSSFNNYFWSDGSTGPNLEVSDAGIYSVTVSDFPGCTRVDSIEIVELPPIEPFINGDTTFCTNDVTVLIGPNGFSSYSWSTGIPSQITAVSAPGTYSLTVTDANGCEGETAVTVSELSLPQPTISGNTILCPGDSLVLDAGPNFFEYVWSTGGIAQQEIISAEGLVTVSVTDDNDCVGQDSVLITALSSSTVSILGQPQYCAGDTVFLVANSSSTDLTYLWSDASSTTNDSLRITESGTYVVTATNTDGCTSIDSLTVSFSDPQLTINGSSSFCEGGVTTLIASPGFVNYEWSTGFPLQVLAVSEPGVYAITATDAAGCSVSDSVTVAENTLPPISIEGDTIVCAGANATLDASLLYPDFQWSTGEDVASITINNGGTYSLTVTDSNGCTNADTLIIATQTLPSPMIVGDLNICDGEAAELSADQVYSSYIWSTGAMVPTITVDVASTVELTVEDEFGCVGSTNVMVQEVALDAIVSLSSDVNQICEGDPAVITAQGGTFSSLAWSDGSSGPNLVVNASGTYTVAALDINGCLSRDTIEIAGLDAPETSLSDSLALCLGTVATIDPGSGFADYLWSTGSINPSIQTTVPGIYSVTVTGTNNCVTIDTVEVYEVPLPSPMINGDLSVCQNQENTLSVAPIYEDYIWTTGENTPTINTDTAGLYGVTVTDDGGCQGTFLILVIELPAPDLDIAVDATSTGLCEGESATLEATGDFTVLVWEDGSTSPNFTVDTAGVYTASAINVFGCVTTDSIEIIQFDFPDTLILGDLSFCENDSVTLRLAEGDFSMQTWTDGSVDSTLVVTAPGNYGVEVTDVNGCVGQENVFVNEIASPAFTIDGADSFCVGDSLSLSVVDTFDVYAWSTLEDGNSVVVDTSGTYSVEVTNSFGCSNTESIDVDFLATPTVAITGDTLFCESENAQLEASAGFASYLWSTNETSQSITTTTPGQYIVTVTDNNACQAIDTIVISEAPAPMVSIVGETTFCADSSVVLAASASFADYLWSDNSSDSTLLVTQGGQYSLEVVDSNGCQATAMIDVTLLDLPAPTILADTLFCQGTDLTLSLNATFAEQTWSDGSTADSTSVNAPGWYAVEVTNADGCTQIDSILVDFFPEPIATISGDTAFCPGANTTLSVSPAFETYLWSDNSDEDTLQADTPGVYEVIVTDINSCQDTATISLINFMTEDPQITGDTEFCAGDTLTLSVADTFETYTWSTGSDSTTTQVTAGGMISLVVTDTNGCTTSSELMLTQFALPVISLADTAICAGEMATLAPGGGFPLYEWSTNESGPTISVDQAGTYSVTVTSAELCSASASALVTVNDLPMPEINGLTSFCTGDTIVLSVVDTFATAMWDGMIDGPELSITSGGEYTFVGVDANGCSGETSISVAEQALPIVEIMGNDFFCVDGITTLMVPDTFATYQWSTTDVGPSIEVDQVGDYTLEVSDGNGCTNEASIAISAIERPIAAAGNDQVLNCETDELTLGSTASSQGPEFVYTWFGPGINSMNDMLENPVVSEPGDYTLLIQDTVFGCLSDTAFVSITEDFELPIFTLTDDGQLNCNQPTGNIEATLDVPVVNAQYEWQAPSGDTFGDTPLISVGEGGWVILSVLNLDNGCTFTDSILVEQDFEAPVVQIGAAEELDCRVLSTLLDANGSSVGAEFEPVWTTSDGIIVSGNESLTPEVSAGGWYFLELTNTTNGCSTLDSILVKEDRVFPIADAGQDQDWDCLIPGANLDGSGSSVGPEFQLEWFFEGNLFAENITTPTVNDPGLYILEVLDQSNGCMATDSVLVIPDQNALVDFSVSFLPPACAGEATGIILIDSIVGGVGPFLYGLNNEPLQASGTFQGLGAGNYLVKLEDARGCTAEQSVSFDAESSIGVTLETNLEEDQDETIKLGDILRIEAALVVEGASLEEIQWTFPDSVYCESCLAFDASPQETSTYAVEAINSLGCVATDQITIFVDTRKRVFVPNAFSPDSDGFNDRITVFGGDDVVAVRSFKIFDRWGSMIFENGDFFPNDLNQGWDGTVNGQLLNTGVFVYMAEVEFIDGTRELFTGDFVILY
ncbi:MAG: gliding motility-associated C-terminal domain-containing protein [Bacteroidota bacterium]